MYSNRQAGKPPFMPNGPFNEPLKEDRGLLPLSRPRPQDPQSHHAYVPRASRPGFRGDVGHGEIHGEIFGSSVPDFPTYEQLPVYSSGTASRPALRDQQRIREVAAANITTPQQYVHPRYSEHVPNHTYGNRIVGAGPGPTALHAADLESFQQLRLHPGSSHNANPVVKSHRGSRGGTMRRRKRRDYGKWDKSAMLPVECLSSDTSKAAPKLVPVPASSAQEYHDSTPAAQTLNAAPRHLLRPESAPFVPAGTLPTGCNFLQDPESYYRAYMPNPTPAALAVRFALGCKLPTPVHDGSWKKIEEVKCLWDSSAATTPPDFPALLSSESIIARTSASSIHSAMAGQDSRTGKDFILGEDAAGLSEDGDGEGLETEEVVQMARDKALSAGRTAVLVLHGNETGLWRD